MPTPPFRSFDEFWPFYLSQHRHPGSRALHVIGTALALGCLVLGFVAPWCWVLAPLVGYGFAWAGHFLLEKNRPATFGHPLWSLRGDFKLLRLTLVGRLSGELARLDAESAPAGPPSGPRAHER